MKNYFWALGCLLMLPLGVFGSEVSAAPIIVQLPTRSMFNAANPGLVTEDFEEARFVANSQAVGMFGPLTTYSDHGVFVRGEIQAGVSFSESPNVALPIMG